MELLSRRMYTCDIFLKSGQRGLFNAHIIYRVSHEQIFYFVLNMTSDTYCQNMAKNATKCFFEWTQKIKVIIS